MGVAIMEVAIMEEAVDHHMEVAIMEEAIDHHMVDNK
jgi:hypothetical protein